MIFFSLFFIETIDKNRPQGSMVTLRGTLQKQSFEKF